MKTYVSYLILVSLLSGYACSQRNAVAPTKTLNSADLVFREGSCGESTKVLKSVAGQKGIVRYNSNEQKHTIVVTIPNTYDSQDIGVVCNLPDNLKIDGLSVTFDGDYRQYDKIPSVKVGGQTFYYLVISSLTFRPSN